MVSEIFESEKLYLLLLLDGTRIYDNEYLESLETVTELNVCIEKQMQKLLDLFFNIKRYFNHDLNRLFGLHVFFACFSKYIFDKFTAVISRT